MPAFDLTPATDDLAALVAAVPDDALAGPTPCPAMTVGALLDHIAGLSLAFTMAATKEEIPGGPAGPSADATALPADWRDEIPARLAALAAAWQAPTAWEGMTMAGPIEMPAPDAALVALDEVVVHGWDLARATGRPFAPDPALLEACHGFVAQFGDERPPGLFGPIVPVPGDAPLLDRVIGLTGRDPGWTPGA
ncbi:MAG TPA: TIGR03086 family metal-binding protein [Iamia sp.]|nr:TIGR03086 family metal-binding protein [Iamia sp.]